MNRGPCDTCLRTYVADGSNGCDEGDSWMLDTALCDLPLVCKVEKKKENKKQMYM